MLTASVCQSVHFRVSLNMRPVAICRKLPLGGGRCCGGACVCVCVRLQRASFHRPPIWSSSSRRSVRIIRISSQYVSSTDVSHCQTEYLRTILLSLGVNPRYILINGVLLCREKSVLHFCIISVL